MTHNEPSEWRWLWREVRPFAPYQAASLFFMLSSSALGARRAAVDEVDDRRHPAEPPLGRAGDRHRAVLRRLRWPIAARIDQRPRQYVRRAAHRLEHPHAAPQAVCSRRSAAFYGKHQVGDLVQRLERDVDMVSEAGSTIVPSVVRMFVEILMTVSAMIFLDWRLSSIVVPLLPLFAYLRHRYRAILRKSSEEVREATGQQSSLLNETLTGAIQIQLLGAEHRFRPPLQPAQSEDDQEAGASAEERIDVLAADHERDRPGHGADHRLRRLARDRRRH